jgi:pimeloyl-ACP methyl ester carboxylesterase
MANRARLIATTDAEADCARITVPTLVVHGEPSLDHLVEVEGTSRYGSLIRGARTAELTGTGHLGSITRPQEFGAVVRDFIQQSSSGRQAAPGTERPASTPGAFGPSEGRNAAL